MSGGGVSRLTDAGAAGLFKLGFKPQTPSDATYISGATFDRSALNYPQNMEVAHILAYTAASGASGATITVETNIFHGDASNMSDEASFKSKSVVITWASDAAKQFHVALSADLSSAKRYVRAKFKETKAGTITVTAPIVAQVVRFGGMMQSPNSSFANAGYFESTDSAA